MILNDMKYIYDLLWNERKNINPISKSNPNIYIYMFVYVGVEKIPEGLLSSKYWQKFLNHRIFIVFVFSEYQAINLYSFYEKLLEIKWGTGCK